MSYETDVLALFAAANPARDDEAVDVVELEPAAYLATLQTRSSEVTQLDERTKERTEKRKPWLTVAAAAVLAILAGVLAFLLNQGADEAPIATAPPVETGAIEGYWTGEEADFFFGDTEYAIVIDGALSDSGTYVTGMREADNRIVTITSGDETVDCTPGDVAIINYDFVFGDAVQLSGTPIDDCDLRPFLDIEILEPTDPFEIPAPTEGIDVEGTWGNESTAFVFADGAFAIVQNGVLVDEGTFELGNEAPTVTFTSSADSSGCAPGSVGQMLITPGSTLSLVADTDQCTLRSFLAPEGPVLDLAPLGDINTGTLPTDIDISGNWSDGIVDAEFVDGTYEFRIDGEIIDAGEYQLTTAPYRVMLESSSAQPNCSTGEYDVALEGGAILLLRPSTDVCPARNVLADVSLAPIGPEG